MASDEGCLPIYRIYVSPLLGGDKREGSFLWYTKAWQCWVPLVLKKSRDRNLLIPSIIIIIQWLSLQALNPNSLGPGPWVQHWSARWIWATYLSFYPRFPYLNMRAVPLLSTLTGTLKNLTVNVSFFFCSGSISTCLNSPVLDVIVIKNIWRVAWEVSSLLWGIKTPFFRKWKIPVESLIKY